MATQKEKDELIEILKFTPIKVILRIQGYGGECYSGRVSREDYEFFKKNKFDLDEYANGWDEWDKLVPEQHQFFPPGSAYECDGLFHASGAELSNLNRLEIENADTYETIWEISPGMDELLEAGVEVDEWGGTDYDELEEGTIAFWGGQGEKGCFFEAEFTLRSPFDPTKLKVLYENCDGWYIISSVEYDGEELDGTGGYSTTGKWAENKWIIIGDEEVYESIPLEEREEGVDYTQFPTDEEIEELDKIAEADKTDWYPKDIKPVHKGDYEVLFDAKWPLSGVGFATWTGRTWKDSEGKKVKILEWRGLKEQM